MILRWLTEDLKDLFDRHPESRVVLWFDEKEEFARLLPFIPDALAGQHLSLLTYDAAGHHGQLWIKWNIEAGPLADAERIVVWFPYAREQMHAAAGGEIRLDSMLEYEYAGKVWLIDGKRPTLFGFLRKHSVALPEVRSEQDALWRGGKDSLLSKFVEKYVARDAEFWKKTPVTPSAIESSLVGDVEEQILLSLADPEGAVADLGRRGLEAEFAGQVRSEFGWDGAIIDNPIAWARDFATTTALCEVFDACGRPDDFPFTTRLPDSNRRDRWLSFARRWMTSRDHEPSFRRWMVEVETTHDLRSWSGRLNGRPQAFRGLAMERWSRFYAALNDAAGSRAELRSFLEREAATVDEEARSFWADVAGAIPGWRLVAQLRMLVLRCREVVDRLDEVSTALAAVEAFTTSWYRIDLAYWILLSGIREADDAEGLLAAADAAYKEYIEETARRFYDLVRSSETWPPPGCQSIRSVVSTLYSGTGRRAVVVIDALRFDLAQQLACDIADSQVEWVLSNLPTETFVGMSSLLPVSDLEASVDDRGRVRLPCSEAGGDLVQRQARWNYLKSQFGARSVGGDDSPADLAALLDAQSPPSPLPNLLVIMDKEIDGMSHTTGSEALHHFETLLRKLGKSVSKLQRWGYPEVHIVTDHGFVLLGSSITPPTASLDKAAAAVADARYAFLKEGAVIEGAVLPFSLDPRHRLLMAPGFRSFKPPGRFFHGGITLQEVVIPHVVVRREVERPRMCVRALVSETEVRTLTFKVELLPDDPRQAGAQGQMPLFAGTPSPIRVRVFLGAPGSLRSSVKEIDVTAEMKDPLKALVHLQPPLDEGEEIEVHVVDAETELEFTQNLKVRVMREFR